MWFRYASIASASGYSTTICFSNASLLFQIVELIYNKNKRTLPWRGHRSEYAVWVSEIMLQQTRVETVIPYFKKWMKLFPNVRALAKASEREVLNAWEGLGYYSRAPETFTKPRRSWLINTAGNFRAMWTNCGNCRASVATSGALASILFGMDRSALDGNLKRVYTRLFDVKVPVNFTEGEKLLLEDRSREFAQKASSFNQALMDLGAMVCTRRNPRCGVCPIAERLQGEEERRSTFATGEDGEENCAALCACGCGRCGANWSRSIPEWGQFALRVAGKKTGARSTRWDVGIPERASRRRVGWGGGVGSQGGIQAERPNEAGVESACNG
ncbi:MAG: hypothetical protein U0X87_14695 [Anaerolineales bacterium]